MVNLPYRNPPLASAPRAAPPTPPAIAVPHRR